MGPGLLLVGSSGGTWGGAGTSLIVRVYGGFRSAIGGGSLEKHTTEAVWATLHRTDELSSKEPTINTAIGETWFCY